MAMLKQGNKMAEEVQDTLLKHPQMTMEILGGLGRKADSRGKAREVKKITYTDYFKNKKYREEKDPMAMDIYAMSTYK